VAGWTKVIGGVPVDCGQVHLAEEKKGDVGNEDFVPGLCSARGMGVLFVFFNAVIRTTNGDYSCASDSGSQEQVFTVHLKMRVCDSVNYHCQPKMQVVLLLKGW
jgi:hypothetical protein